MARTIICAAVAAGIGALAMSIPAQAVPVNAGLNAAVPATVQDVRWRGHRWHRWHHWRRWHHRRHRVCWRDWRGFRRCVWRW